MTKNPSSPASEVNGKTATFNVERIRARFQALSRKVGDIRPIYFDNPAGTQVPFSVVQAISQTLINANANLDGAFETSRSANEILLNARRAMADFLNAPSPSTIVFGPNMTTLTMALSRAIGKTLSEGDEIIVTHLDHDGNIAPWLLIAEDYKLKVRWVDVQADGDCTLKMDELEKHVDERTKVIAVGYASNALGTINDVKKVVELARKAGALSFIDAVQYAPHGPIDVQDLDCDFLVTSSYKFFGPHLGALYGKQKLLERLPAYKVRPAPNQAPNRWETGTQNHEALSGLIAAVDYLAWVGEEFGKPYVEQFPGFEGRRLNLKVAMRASAEYEKTLSHRLLKGFSEIEGVTVRGITAHDRLDERVPTFAFSVEGKTPREVAEALGKVHIYAWDGNYYALAIMERLGVEDKGGLVRIGAAHYNTIYEVDRFLEELAKIAGVKKQKVKGQPDKVEEKPKVDPAAETKPSVSTKPFDV
jgi:cysteine desulfurase family protein (TIGR01976 family)